MNSLLYTTTSTEDCIMTLRKFNQEQASALFNKHHLYNCNVNSTSINRYINNSNFSRLIFRSLNLKILSFYNCNFSYATFYNCDFSDCRFDDCNLMNAKFYNCYWKDAYLEEAKNIPVSLKSTLNITPEGDLIVYKKIDVTKDCHEAIAKLLIPKEAKRGNATGRKCRAEYAKVLSIKSINNKVNYKKGTSQHDTDFVYRVGTFVEPTEPFDENNFDECSTGIHFYLTRYEAEQH